MNTQEIKLYWHKYKFFEYEKHFAFREIQSLLRPKQLKEVNDKIIVSGLTNFENINKLVYFSHAEIEKEIFPTQQFHFENGSGTTIRHKRQNTRYSVHGLHEYKGKFNPQVVRSLFNIYDVKSGSKVLDPFCGSGTSIVEAAHDNISAYGTDINPLAVFIANAKIACLNISANQIIQGKKALLDRHNRIKKNLELENNSRIQYLKNWFPLEVLIDIEALRLAALEIGNPLCKVLLVIISNLLRDYSLQEPSDLRIRRRFSPFPEVPLIEQLMLSIDSFVSNLKEFQSTFNLLKSDNQAFNVDIKHSAQLDEFKEGNSFDFAITSPPYATALPYIDTQRLSLVWLNLITASQIKTLESDLIGSRDFKTKVEQQKWVHHLQSNKQNLSIEVHLFCLELFKKLKPEEGFRKRALPALLYRYFHDMGLAFKEVHRLLKPSKYFCLIVGHNHTMIGGSRTDIDTPKLLSYIGKQAGFNLHEIIELDAYQRYGLNSSNAVQKESLIVFKK